MPRRPWLLLALLILGCPPKQRPPATSAQSPPPAPAAPDPTIDRVLATARGLLGSNQVVLGGRSYRADCSGFVAAVWDSEGVDIVDEALPYRSGTEIIYRGLEDRAVSLDALRPGDLLFFDDTYDRNGNGLRDDAFSHIALVDEIDGDGTVWFFHFASGRVNPNAARVHLLRPADARTVGVLGLFGTSTYGE